MYIKNNPSLEKVNGNNIMKTKSTRKFIVGAIRK
jgi:hypothetical protein